MQCSWPERLCNAIQAKSLKEEGFDSYLQAGHIADRPLLVVCGLLLFREGPPMSAWWANLLRKWEDEKTEKLKEFVGNRKGEGAEQNWDLVEQKFAIAGL